MERTVVAVQTGRAPITGQIFDRQAIKAYGIKMLRKPNSDMNKQDIQGGRHSVELHHWREQQEIVSSVPQ